MTKILKMLLLSLVLYENQLSSICKGDNSGEGLSLIHYGLRFDIGIN
jgi:hypothetical protein